MGIDRTDYIMYGWKLPGEMKDRDGEEINFWEDEKYEKMVCGGDDEYDLVLDSMSGDYTAFGKRFASGGDKYEGWNFEELDIKEMNAEEVKTKFRDVFNADPTEEPKLFIFTHYS